MSMHTEVCVASGREQDKVGARKHEGEHEIEQLRERRLRRMDDARLVE